MRLPSRFIFLPLLLVLSTVALGQAKDTPPNPFAAPQATVHFAPDRDYDLLHLALDLTIDYPKRSFVGIASNRISALRDRLSALKLHCGKNLLVTNCTVGGVLAKFTRSEEMLLITAPKPLARHEVTEVVVRYASGGVKTSGGIMADSGLHWIEPSNHRPNRVGFWTQGEPDLNRQWVPTWDYPNQLTTTEARVTVPADWTVVGNGELRSNRLNPGGKTRTFHWQMTQPHATYLLSLVAGPFDVKMAKWRDVSLMYVAPKGKGGLLESSFGDTSDMLSFFSDITGVKYAWPKYAQNAMYDFGGGMENVSATTLPEGALTDPREGFHTMASLNAHELAHQWFGDLVTCKDWGQIWLNESFATFFEALYMEHSRGATAYAQEIEGDMQGYFDESRRYKRPIETNMYPSADAMFDSHTYPKGAAVLHTLRRLLGDKLFFAGIHEYLTEHRNSPVDTHDLCMSMTRATGVNLEPFFEQWVLKPGHPVIDYTWTWDEAARKIVVNVKQTQDTKDGTPIYHLDSSVGIIVRGSLARTKVTLDQASQVFKLDAAAKPDAVVLDPDHDFLREIPVKHWSAIELPSILRYAPNPADRNEALKMMLSGMPNDTAVKTAAEVVAADTDRFPVFNLTPLVSLKREDLRPLFRANLRHASFERREKAIRALGQLPKTDEDMATLRALVSDKEPYAIVGAAITVLAAWDLKANLAAIYRAAEMPSLHEQIRSAAFAALASAHTEEALARLLKASSPESDPDVRYAALSALGKVEAAEPKTREALRMALRDSDFEAIISAANAIRERKDKGLLPVLQELKAHPPTAAAGHGWFPGFVDKLINDVSKS